MAVRAAVSLGFHSDHVTGDFDAIERETRVGVWYGCIALDRYHSAHSTGPSSLTPSLGLWGCPSDVLWRFHETSIAHDGRLSTLDAPHHNSKRLMLD